jgi:hypothetical protein
MVVPDGFVSGTDQQARVQGYGNAVRGAEPTQFVNGAPREDEGSPGLRSVTKALSGGEDFVPDVPGQYHVQEIMQVFVLRNDTRRNVVILDCETSPLDRRAA